MRNTNDLGINNEINTGIEDIEFKPSFQAPNIDQPIYVYVSCEFETIEGEVLSFDNVIVDRRYRLQPSKFENLQEQLGISDLGGKFISTTWGDHASTQEYIFQSSSKTLTSVLNIQSNGIQKFH